MQVLEILIDRRGDVVSRAEIEDLVWPNSVIGEKTLTRAISELRRAFGDDAGKPAVIETVSRRGYRLIHPAVEIVDSPRSRTLMPAAAAAIVLGLIAVWIVVSRDSPTRDVRPLRQLTSEPGHELTPSPSPSGELIAYAKTPKDEASTSIFIKQSSGRSELRLTDDAGFDISPRWSPDGGRIAFMRYDDATCGIHVVPALGGDVTSIAQCQLHPRRVNFAPTLDWSPDGSRIAFVDRPDGDDCTDIVVIDLDSGKKSALSTSSASACVNDVDPVFSPDGKHIAFTRFIQRSVGDLYLTALDDARTRRLTEDYRSQLGIAWESNTSIIFSSDRSGTYRLWRVDVDTREIRWVPSDGMNIKRPSVNSRGTITYENWLYDVNIWTRNAGDSTPRQLVASTVWDFHPGISPDGAEIAFVSNRSGNFELWLMEQDGDARQLTHSANRVVGFPAWSTDGQRIAYVLQEKDRFVISVVARDGAMVMRIGAEGNMIAPTWSPGDELLVYGSDVTGEWEVWTYDPARGQHRQLTDSGGYRGMISSQGDLYFTKLGETGIWRKRAGFPEEKIIDELIRTDWANWQIVDDKIVFPSPSGGELLVWDWRSPGGYSAGPAIATRSANAQGVQVSKDMNKAIWTQLDRTEADVFVGRIDGGF